MATHPQIPGSGAVNFAQNSVLLAGMYLGSARQVLHRMGPASQPTGKGVHIEQILAVIPNKILDRFRRGNPARDQAQQVVEDWEADFQKLHSKFNNLSVIAQCGMKELVYF